MPPSDIDDLVRRLIAVLGPTLVSTLAGSRDTQAAVSWDGNGRDLDVETIARLECAEAVWRQVSDAEGDHLARVWFIGANPFLRGDTVITAIREGRFDEVAGAAQAFVDGSFTG